MFVSEMKNVYSIGKTTMSAMSASEGADQR